MGVFVIGMHRSGTSAVAASLQALGLDVGAPERLLAADAGNPAGYFELQDIGKLNDEILEWRGGRWDCPPQPVEGWELDPDVHQYYRRAAGIVSARLTRNRWVIKDPRITLLLPLWRRAVLDRCAAVVIVRSPMEVAWSLALRNGLPILTGLSLWSEYNRAALAGLGGLPVHVCTYDDLVTDPGTTLAAIASSLETWNELPAGADVDAAAARVRPELRRNTWPRDTPDALEIPSEIERLAKFLTDQVGAHDLFEPGHPPAAPWERALLDERRLGVSRLRTSMLDTTAAVRERDQIASERDQVTGERDALRTDRDDLRRERDDLVRLRDETARVRDEIARERDSLAARVERAEEELDVARRDAAEVVQLRADAGTARAENAQLSGALEEARARVVALQTDLDGVRARYDESERALRQAVQRWERLEQRVPVRIARYVQRRVRARRG